MDLTTLSSLRVCWTLKTMVKCNFFSCPRDPFVTSCLSDVQTVVKRIFLSSPSDLFITSCVSDAQNCGKIDTFHVSPSDPFLTSLDPTRADYWLKTVVK